MLQYGAFQGGPRSARVFDETHLQLSCLYIAVSTVVAAEITDLLPSAIQNAVRRKVAPLVRSLVLDRDDSDFRRIRANGEEGTK